MLSSSLGWALLSLLRGCPAAFFWPTDCSARRVVRLVVVLLFVRDAMLRIARPAAGTPLTGGTSRWGFSAPKRQFAAALIVGRQTVCAGGK
ncbi:hypothetical protein U875_27005 [Pandoraea pnomenusa 3kgm]|nr:hypothetical protein U875_27005 [Pandoraea pnomenusa 3kgm]